MIYLAAIPLLAALIRLTLDVWDRHDLEGTGLNRSRFLRWLSKGFVLPVMIWMIVNFGISTRYPPLLHDLAVAKITGRGWLSGWLLLLPGALWVVGSYWVAVTFLWLLAVHLLEMDCSRREIAIGMLVWGAVLSPVVAVLVYWAGWAGAGLAVTIVLLPVVDEQFALGIPRKRIRQPIYDRALAKIKTGNYTAAEKEVIRQLTKRDSDFAGWLMLAELFANHLNDLPEAERLIQELCHQTDITREQMCQALHRLADWQLYVGKDPAAARRSLEQICQAFPATHYGDVARQRIEKLPSWPREDRSVRRTHDHRQT